ncbi:MAG: hypothetical protein JXQ27_07550 [Acidobacteria bacterium]|nr:hypothetical protein [Acidobacteriota bacterium]
MRRFAGTLLLITLAIGPAAAGADDLRAEFDRRYAAWKTSQKQPQRSFFASLMKELYDLIELGRPALPYFIEKLEQAPEEDYMLVFPVLYLTKKSLADEDIDKFIKMYGSRGSFVSARGYVHWWNVGRLKSSERFAKHYTAWKKAKQSGDKSAADMFYMDIWRMGLDVLPKVMDKIRQGDEELIPIVSRWTSFQLKEGASLTECLAWWEAHGQEYRLPPPPKE